MVQPRAWRLHLALRARRLLEFSHGLDPKRPCRELLNHLVGDRRQAEAKHNFEEAKRNLKNGNVDGALRDIDSLKRNGREIDQGRRELQSDRRAIQFDQLRNGMNKRRLENDLGL